MSHKPTMLPYKPVTEATWDDFVRLFGARGACGGCWCMAWRLSKADWESGKGSTNKRRMHRLVKSGNIPGIIGYDNDDPVAWCSIAPRESFPRLEKARSLKPVDSQPVWSISCMFVSKDRQRSGLSTRLLLSAVDFARESGATIVEGYPYDPRADLPPPFVWTGLVVSFKRAGFVQVARPSATRAIMRRVIGK